MNKGSKVDLCLHSKQLLAQTSKVEKKKWPYMTSGIVALFMIM